VTVDLLLVRLALAFYLAGVAVAFTALLAKRQRLLRWLPVLAAPGLLLNMPSFARAWWSTGSVPLGDAPERITFLAWAAVLCYVVAAFLYRAEVLGAIILPLAVVLELVSNYLPHEAVDVPERLEPGLLFFHIGVATLGVAAMFLGFGASILYLVKERGLKSKRPTRLLMKLPSLMSCDQVGHLALLWGFPLLTLAIITGAIWSANARAFFWLASGRETFSLLAWSILGVILFARLVRGWRGRKAAYLTIVAFLAVLTRMLGGFIPL
jgi:ABC-type uncharacterized transport system permease subunit